MTFTQLVITLTNAWIFKNVHPLHYGLSPESQAVTHASREAEDVLVAAVEGSGGAGCVPSLIPELLPEQSWTKSCQLSILVTGNCQRLSRSMCSLEDIPGRRK